MGDGELFDRITRIEDRLEIDQLPIRYALAVDSRDIESWLALFVPDVRVGRRGTGREALREFITPRLRWFYRSIHQIVGHRVELLGPDVARGQVYCRAEHEVGEQWVVMAIRYDDEYRPMNRFTGCRDRRRARRRPQRARDSGHFAAGPRSLTQPPNQPTCAPPTSDLAA